MSRSLDKTILSSLKVEDPRPAYHDIASLFSRPPNTTSDELLEIEFLGTSHPLEPGINYLRDGSAIAVPKLRLAQAFMVARQVLQKYLDARGTNLDHPVPEDVLLATPVLLLMDPEHLTAANTRKRALQHKLAVASTTDDRHAALHTEKQLIDSLLTSRLHRHTKSPTLWAHRRWLIELCKRDGVVFDLHSEITKIVMASGERHPRNHYAWHHARWLSSPHFRNQNMSVSDESTSTELLEHVKNWCLKHPGDISGWSFLTFVLAQVNNSDAQQTIAARLIIGDVINIAESFRWSNESVWDFLRGVVATKCINADDMGKIKAARTRLSVQQPSIPWLKTQD